MNTAHKHYLNFSHCLVLGLTRERKPAPCAKREIQNDYYCTFRHWVPLLQYKSLIQWSVPQNPQLNLGQNRSIQLSLPVPNWLDCFRKSHCHVSDPNRKSQEGHLAQTHFIPYCSHLYFCPSLLSWPQGNCLLTLCWIFFLHRDGVWLDISFPVWAGLGCSAGGGWVYS